MKKLFSKEVREAIKKPPISADTGSLNELWANETVRHLISHGIRYFCLAPGSRATPLALAIANHPLAESFVHFDERGLAYHALGYAKSRQQAACIITTSGSAVANLLPAIIEASAENIPLILITADRPSELRECASNQTIDQVGIFSKFVRFAFDVPCPSRQISTHFLSSMMASAVQKARFEPGGPVHVNCMFREPFFPHKEQSSSFPSIDQMNALPTTELFPIVQTPNLEALESLADELSSIEQGIIIAAGQEGKDHAEGVLALSKRLGWPVFSDVLSGFRSIGRERSVAAFSELILKSSKHLDDIKTQAIIQVGDRIVSKTTLEWIERQPLSHYIHVAPHPNRIDPLHLITHRIESPISSFCKEFSQMIPQNEETSWESFWSDISKHTEEHLINFFLKKKTLSEQQVIRFITDELDNSTHLFLSNSLPIRDAEALLYPRRRIGKIFANRGHSGIDGNISTAIGISKGIECSLIAVIGDLAFLHDVNSLSQLQTHPHNMTFIVINNQGGGIFSFLPIAQKSEVLDPFFANAHSYQFEPMATQFNLKYFQPKTIDQFLSSMEKSRQNSRHSLIEIRTDREENYREHADLIAYLKQHSIAKELKKCYPHL